MSISNMLLRQDTLYLFLSRKIGGLVTTGFNYRLNKHDKETEPQYGHPCPMNFVQGAYMVRIHNCSSAERTIEILL